ncbi:hypothetical protein A4H97_18410 [Niastella yeongjuensis]|uniref:Uncharacterized protein n=1 Tax=Niastella yeongjuensis TaxID=354355 RepID=A0A1V9DXV9_9BACT|nr:hypothetical protein [Niastella yeongjuensis]OQP38692.1 hypothetical protein A4H97_18410 [Niastella yeongjuensis]SEO36162.1 hypothetical protein SAMN05660816_02720 [Niastella yeongjuensis]
MAKNSGNNVRNETQWEELPGILTKDIFVELAGYEGDLCVSILMPTHKSGVEVNEQVDKSTFKNVVQQVEKKLAEKKKDPALTKSVLQPAYDLLTDEIFWRSLDNGLAVYIADGFFKYVKLAAPVIQLIHVNTSFYVSPLIPYMVRTEHFYLLDIAKKFPRFYRADGFGIERLQIEEMPFGVDDVVHFEEKDGDTLFRTGGKGGRGSANFHGIGGGKPEENENIAIYLQEVDNTIWQSHLNKENVPLLLAGQNFLIPIFKSVSRYKNIWPEALTGNHHQQSDNDLYEKAMKVIKPYFDQPLQNALKDYGNKLVTALTSSMIDTIIPATYYGKVSHLFVKKGLQAFGTFNKQDNKLVMQVQEGDLKQADDLIDKAVTKTIQNGGDVYFLDAEQMPNQSELAALFRY